MLLPYLTYLSVEKNQEENTLSLILSDLNSYLLKIFTITFTYSGGHEYFVFLAECIVQADACPG